MPFAPVVLEEKAADVFDANCVDAYTCRFMTITCNVRPVWRKHIAAVVHGARRDRKPSHVMQVRSTTMWFQPSSEDWSSLFKDTQYSDCARIIEKARKATAANASTKLGRRKLP